MTTSPMAPSHADSVTNAPLSEVDPEIAAVLRDELARQRDTLEMIASENFAPRAVLEAQGSVLTNKYAEGYPGRRYYGGCEHVDVAENLAIERVKALFGAEFANVQPHSGAQANAAALSAMIVKTERPPRGPVRGDPGARTRAASPTVTWHVFLTTAALSLPRRA